jgi:hypothetical protein
MANVCAHQALLDGPKDIASWAEIRNVLKFGCGDIGLQVITAVELHTAGFVYSFDCPSLADHQCQLNLALLTAACAVLASAVVAKSVKFFSESAASEEDTAMAIRARGYKEFKTNFAEQAATLKVLSALEGTTNPDLLRNRWLASFAGMEADEVMDEGNGLPGSVDGVATPLWIFSTQAARYVLECLPEAALALLFKSTLALAGPGDTQGTLKSAWKSTLKEAADPALYQQAVYVPNTKDGGEASIRRQLRRLQSVVSVVVSVLAATSSTLSEMSRNYPALNHDLPQLPGLANLLAKPLEVFITSIVEIRPTGYPDWVLPKTGIESMAPVVKRSQRSDGLRFLGDQLRLEGSTYRFPPISAKQKQWEDWCSKIAELSSMFYDFPAPLIISMLLGPVPGTDRRIYGWAEKVQEMRSLGAEPTIAQFLGHVRTVVLPNNTTRREAARELQGLVTKESRCDLNDCLAVAAKFRQLFAQLFPTSSTEPEPLTRFAAVEVVHMIMQSLHTGGKPSLWKAWKNYTAYDNSVMFERYVDEKWHRGNESEVLTASYLAEVCRHLESAHRQFVQTSEPEDNTQSRGGRAHSVNAAAQLLGVAPSVLAAWTKDNSPSGSNKRKEPGSGPSTPRPPNAPPRLVSSSPRGRAGRGRGSPARGRGSGDGGRGRFAPRDLPRLGGRATGLMFGRALRSMRGTEGVPDAGTIRPYLDLPPVTFEQAVTLVEGGSCVLCQEYGHSYGACPAQRLPNVHQRLAVQAFCQLFASHKRAAQEDPVA